MNLDEYERKLISLVPEELDKFNTDFGGGDKTVAQRVREFVDHPEHERRICQLLGLTTEADKMVTAALDSARAARASSIAAKWSIIIAALAFIISIIQALLGWLRP